MAGRRILITGISSYLGTELARRLEADPGVEYVAGLDTRPPRLQLEKTDFIEADIRSPTVLKLLQRMTDKGLVERREAGRAHLLKRRPGIGVGVETREGRDGPCAVRRSDPGRRRRESALGDLAERPVAVARRQGEPVPQQATEEHVEAGCTRPGTGEGVLDRAEREQRLDHVEGHSHGAPANGHRCV